MKILLIILYFIQIFVIIVDLAIGDKIFIKKKKDIIYFMIPFLVYIIGFVIMIKSIMRTWRNLE